MDNPRFSQNGGLIPAVVQDYETHAVLMIGYLDQEAWSLTLSTNKMHYFSRKKNRIWQKGEQSGHVQIVKNILMNCDHTALLFQVEQIGGCCDLGYFSCFQKQWDKSGFIEREERVFNPAEVYGEKYSEKLTLGLPSGSLESITFSLLELSGLKIERNNPRSYHPTLPNVPDLEIVMARAQELPHYVSEGLLDFALTGADLVKESELPVKWVSDLGYNKLGLGPVSIVVAVPLDSAVNSLGDLAGKKIATMYVNITSSFFLERGIDVKVIPSVGATEGKVPKIADAIVELAETGNTLQANNLKPIAQVGETTVHIVANNGSWGYTWKRRKIEELARILETGAAKMPINAKKLIDLKNLA